MEGLRRVAPSATLPSAPVQRAYGAVLKGPLRYFNHYDQKWVLCFDTVKVYVGDVMRTMSNVLVVLLHRERPSVGTYSCVHGGVGTSPYVLAPTEEEALNGVVVGYYTESRSKQRRFRIEGADSLLCLGGVAIRVDKLYVEATFC